MQLKNQTKATDNFAAANPLERIAQGILVAHAWVAGPAMSERERIQRELVKAESARRAGASLTG
jgi:hypothetical protein